MLEQYLTIVFYNNNYRKFVISLVTLYQVFEGLTQQQL
jgi:hypothetical protein